MNLRYIKNNLKFTPNKILDIGCNVGQFYNQCRNVWGNVYIYLIDGNDKVEEDIKKLGVDYKITVLSDEKKIITWYSTKENLKCTGDSYYRENTKHYTDDKVIKIEKETETLDELFLNEHFDFIKMDTQGSEIDIIKGGLNLCKKAKYILLEVALTDYNLNAPQKKEVNEFMKSIGFKPKAVLENHFLNGNLFQEDILYENSVSQ